MRRFHQLIGLSLAVVLASCSDSGVTKPDPTSRASDTDPPGAAQALSLGGGGRLEGKTDLDNALNCAVALRGTITAVGALRGDDSEEIRALKEVQRIYRARAGELAEAEGKSANFAAREIERRSLTTFAPEQAQLAMACLTEL